METRANYFLVGLFTLVFLAMLAIVSIWLARTELDQRPQFYHVFFESSVTGLQKGSPVRYRGVPVGKVNDIRIDPGNIERVRVLLEIEQDVSIRRGTEATLELQGITGYGYIQLVGGREDAPPLSFDYPGQIPIIPATASAFSEIFDRTPELLTTATRVADRLANALSPDNVNALSRTLANAEKLTASLAAGTGDVPGMVNNVKSLASSTELEMQKLSSRIDAPLSAVAAAALAVEKMAVGADKTLNRLQPVAEQWQRQTAPELTALLLEMRILSQDLSRLLRRLEQQGGDFILPGGAASGGVIAPATPQPIR